MTERDNFILRWARLKHEAESTQETEQVSAGVEATAAPSRNEVAAPDKAFDLARLPSIESIVADTDIGAFLQSGVPLELTRAALRRAWRSDPAIRDFIGIAENQWDFNDPDAIPGFGPLRAGDHAQAALTQVSGMPENVREVLAEMPASVERGQPSATYPRHATADPDAPLTPAKMDSADQGVSSLSNEKSEAGANTERTPATNDCEPSAKPRRHGSALPR